MFKYQSPGQPIKGNAAFPIFFPESITCCAVTHYLTTEKPWSSHALFVDSHSGWISNLKMLNNIYACFFLGIATAKCPIVIKDATSLWITNYSWSETGPRFSLTSYSQYVFVFALQWSSAWRIWCISTVPTLSIVTAVQMTTEHHPWKHSRNDLSTQSHLY